MLERIQLSPAFAAGLKAALVGFLILILLIPIQMIKALRSERENVSEGAIAEVSDMAGGRTVLATPYLAIPTVRTEQRTNEDGKIVDVLVHETYCVFPSKMNAAGTARVTERWRGIYEVPVHECDFNLELEFDFRLKEAGSGGLVPDWGAARLYYAYDDPRSLRESPVLTDGSGNAGELLSDRAPLDLAERSVSIPLALTVDPATGGARFVGQLRLSLSGARSISFLPLADLNRISLSGNWPSPSFSGYRLPVDRRYSETGFEALWTVNESGRTVPKILEMHAFSQSAARGGAFGVAFFSPVDIYQIIYRALRYAVLFLVIPFAALFLLETLSRKRLHPVQYLLVGLANCVFYVLLLAAAEHLPFVASYLGAAAAVSLLTAYYIGAVLPVKRIGLYAFAVLALQYGYLYSALESEDYALLIGSLGLFVLIAAAMIATRKIDWYGGKAATASVAVVGEEPEGNDARP